MSKFKFVVEGFDDCCNILKQNENLHLEERLIKQIEKYNPYYKTIEEMWKDVKYLCYHLIGGYEYDFDSKYEFEIWYADYPVSVKCRIVEIK